MVKNLPTMWETWVQSLGWEDPWRRECLPTPVFLPGDFHGQSKLAGCSPWGLKELDSTECLSVNLMCMSRTTHQCCQLWVLRKSDLPSYQWKVSLSNTNSLIKKSYQSLVFLFVSKFSKRGLSCWLSW